ncbi:hypothetical protein [Pseudoalteromonas ulvae]|uniref:Uncharacterized protein n=1 Tax=Pseudoalteromonas ulvae TaxID=107327 RepID=A0A244CMG5_PSEDV|nr:hypothetical protein [Pseudoalteromonas ulvae]OUL56738.1 hypothetical protein B1199_15295 [Pseudoalteromonas ulvae]
MGVTVSSLKSPDTSTITHEFAHAVFAPAEVSGINLNNAYEHYKQEAKYLHLLFQPTVADLSIFEEIKTSAYVFDKAVTFAQGERK